MEPDFSGWATKNDLLCSDGRTIRSGAFKHCDKMKVPLVYQHQRNNIENVIGHAILENRPEGVYTYGFFNETPKGLISKQAVAHGDIDMLSIYANNLNERGKNVMRGDIKEVSLVIAGANPGAFIDNVYVRHSDDEDYEIVDGEGIIYTGLTLEHVLQHEDTDEEPEVADSEKTVKDVFDSMTEEQKNVVYFMIGEAVSEAEGEDAEHSDEEYDGEDVLEHIDNSIKEGFNQMARNVFEASADTVVGRPSLTHDQLTTIVEDAKKLGSFKESFLQHAGDFGIDNIEVLFPDAKTITTSPEFIKRRTEWVDSVISGAKHSPFSRIKTILADITANEARARGYVKGALKTEEILELLKRTTNPTTVYKKQKLDRDDIVDITDLDVVVWLKAEMRLMLDEELARAILIGDGRLNSDPDKIKDPAAVTDGIGIRSIAKDHDMYAHQVTLSSNLSVDDKIEALIRARSNFRGSGQPVFYTTLPFITDMLLTKDKVGRRVYDSIDALAKVLMVSKIIDVEVMEGVSNLVGIFVNIGDYTIGADKGGQLAMFDDFDIDYNQYKYLMETRISGALTKPKSAVVVWTQAGTAATPAAPSFDGPTNTITIPTTTGINYQIDGTNKTGTVVITETTDVEAVAKTNYYIPAGTVTNWTFVYTP